MKINHNTCKKQPFMLLDIGGVWGYNRGNLLSSWYCLNEI